MSKPPTRGPATHRIFELPDGRWKAECKRCPAPDDQHRRQGRAAGHLAHIGTRHDCIRWWKNHAAEAEQQHRDHDRRGALTDRLFGRGPALTDDERAELERLGLNP